MALAQAAATLRAGGDRAREGDRVDFFVVENRLADDRASPDDEIEHALGNAGAHDDFGQRVGAARDEIGGLEDDRVAISERRRDLPGRDREREVPRRDDADDPERLACDLNVDVRPHAGEFLAGNP